MNIVILDGFTVTQNDLEWCALAQMAGISLTVYPRTQAADVLSRCSEADAVLTNKVVLDRDTMLALPRLRYIGVLATGYNVVDTATACQQGITVTNIPAYSTPSVAQLVFAHLLNVTNCVAHYAEANRQGCWSQSPDFMWMDTPLTELQGKTFGIRGMGNIGTQVARIAQAFGMRVIAATEKAVEGVERVSWDELLRQSDVLSLHCPLTDETYELINSDTLMQMKPSAILINTGRGPLVNEQAVADALLANRLGAYCADVLSVEPPSSSNPLLSAPRCYLTPHIAWASRESRERLIHTATENIRAFLLGTPVNVVN